jgi:hypothetical protein
MGFEIAALDTLTQSQIGSPMTLVNYRTGAPMMKADGSLVTITLLGRHSDIYREQQRQMNAARADRAARNIVMSPEEISLEDGRVLAACTVAWTIDEMDGQPFPCTPENARKL